MGNVFQFQAKAQISAKQNLDDFIQRCKNELTAFGEDCWGEHQWKITYGSAGKATVARFSTNTAPFTSYHYEPMAEPYRDFAKAYIRYIYSLKPVKNLQRQMEALRGLEETLIEANGKAEADILELDGRVLDALTTTLRKRYRSPEALNKIGYQVERILDFCRDKLIIPSLPEWSNPFKKQKNLTIALDAEGREFRSKKLPSDEEMMLVAKLFNVAPKLDIETEYYTSLMALLMVAPSRGSELIALPVDCIVREEDSLRSHENGHTLASSKRW